jgi:hypothetical protein
LPNLQGLFDLVGFVSLPSVSCFFGFLCLDLQGFGNLAGLPDPPALQVLSPLFWLPNLQGLPDLVGFVPLPLGNCFFGFLYLDLRGFGDLAGLAILLTF